ncbi:GNAT family N-acetyltransferase [Phytomonospora endophytica]|uniref:Ribosomal protein S18 acetylase RimI-like enzyme n=1 Tax=Phytomonospora endophytica TaxID=714109 RepID=A0A841FUR9_9ACTN|nr:GNAT family N-acetyltransferase [Phytomonospora endophytica]MBB6036259.1 ribosomal protein S18 acetylase RimI-like enzyme [Phytomonospora endophytica]GIG67166.1 acetyltransferase [Phytomonospora endophytica]
MPSIRHYRPADEAALRDICVRTAHVGGDARPHYRDPGILPEIFAVPYARLDPSLAFVADDGERAVGYILGTGDTTAFVRRFRDQWLPSIADRYPAPTGVVGLDPTPDDVMRHLLHTPERMLVPELAAYPAHLHIDLLPGFQRAGHGRALVAAFVDALKATGVPGVHLGMVTENTAARAFYDRVGFHEIDVADAGPITYLGMRW